MLRRWKELHQEIRFDLPVILFLGLMVGILALRANPLLYDLDVGWLVRTGEYLLDHRSLPPGDLYSFSNPGKPWILYQWAFEVYLGGLHHLAKLGGVVWGTAILIALTYALLLHHLVRIGLSPGWATALGFLAALANMFHWLSRPLTATLLCYTLQLCLLEAYRLRPRNQLLLLPVIFLLWANTHLGFVFGLLVLALYGVWGSLWPGAFRGPGAPRDYRILFIALLCFGATLLNPYGPKLFSYLGQLAFSTTMNAHIRELQSPDFHAPWFVFFLLQLILLLWLSGPKYPGRPVLLVLVTVTLCMGLYSARHLTLFAVPTAMHLGYSIVAREKPPVCEPGGISKAGWLVAGAVAVLSLFWVVAIERWHPGFYQFDSRRVPQGAVRYLAAQVEGGKPLKIFNLRDFWGSYLIYALFPQIRVYLDTRFDMYGDEFFKEAINTQQKALLDFRVVLPLNVDYLLVDKKSLERRQVDQQKPKGPFLLVYEDDQALLYRVDRNSP